MGTTEPTTITELLTQRTGISSSLLHFLDDSGDITSSVTFLELTESAKRIAKALLSSGLRGGGTDIVVAKFNDQRTHILLFWGCAFGTSIIYVIRTNTR